MHRLRLTGLRCQGWCLSTRQLEVFPLWLRGVIRMLMCCAGLSWWQRAWGQGGEQMGGTEWQLGQGCWPTGWVGAGGTFNFCDSAKLCLPSGSLLAVSLNSWFKWCLVKLLIGTFSFFLSICLMSFMLLDVKLGLGTVCGHVLLRCGLKWGGCGGGMCVHLCVCVF